jgi:hypothetical protein
VIHVERVSMPDGLRALAYRDRRGNLVVYVSDGLDAKGQRAAIIEAIRASRRAGWRKAGLLPVGVGLAAAIRALLGRVGHTIGARPVAWGAAATATALGATAAGVFIVSPPQPHHSSAAGRPHGPGTVLPVQPSGQQPGGQAPHHRQVHPVAVASVSPGPGQPASSGKPRPAPTSPASPAPGPAPAPAPSPSPAPAPAPTQPVPVPVPVPAPSPTVSTPGICVIVLGIKVCVPPVSVSLKV